MEAQNHALLCQEIESELRELCLECRKRSPSIKEYTERAILKIRHHRDLVEKAGGGAALPEFPLHEVLKSLLMACETFQAKIVLISLSCLQRLIHRRVLKDETVAIIINLMKEQAINGDEQVQLKVLQTIMATPAHMTLVNELVVEQLLQLLYVLHNSASVSVHHTACAGLRQLTESICDRAASMAKDLPDFQLTKRERRDKLGLIAPVIQQSPAALPTLTPIQAPVSLSGALRIMYMFVQDLCVMVDHDAHSFSSRYSMDAGERMRHGSREGYWLSSIKFPRPLSLELLGTSITANPEVFFTATNCFELLRHGVCGVLLKNLRGCFDFAILIRSIHLLQQILKCPDLAAHLIPELQVFLHLMLDLTTAERSPWQRATSLEFLKSVCEDSSILLVLHDHSFPSASSSTASASSESGSKTFTELVNSLSKLMHQVCFSSGMDSSALLQSAAGSAARELASAQRAGGTFFGNASSLLGTSGLGTLVAGNTGTSVRDLMTGGGVAGLSAGQSRRDANGSNGSGPGAAGGVARSGGSKLKLLLLMSEAEPPTIQTSFLVQLVVECVFAIVSSLYRLLLDASEESAIEEQVTSSTEEGASVLAAACVTHSVTEAQQLALLDGQTRGCTPFAAPLTTAQERCRAMVADAWASLLSALSLLLNFTTDDALLLQALRCVQTLLYCCGRLGLDQARDACLLQVSRYALPGQSHEDSDTNSGSGHGASTGLSAKNALCFKALLNFCNSFGALLGVGGWTIVLRSLDGLERSLQKSSSLQAFDLAALRQALDSLFQTTADLPEKALCEIVKAAGDHVRSLPEGDEGAVLSRVVDLCTFNLTRLLGIWDSVLHIVLNMCSTDQCSNVRSAAAAAVCRILSLALRKGTVLVDNQEKTQEALLQPLEALLYVPQEDVRARVCEGLLTILQASGQELQPAAWRTMIQLVESSAKMELQRAGFEFYLPQCFDSFSPERDPSAAESATTPPPFRPGARTSNGLATDSRETSSVLPTLFQLLELIIHDFMENIPCSSVPKLTATIGAFARFGNLGVNSSLAVVGFLWNVADAVGLYHCTSAAGEHDGKSTGDLWVQIFMHLRVLAVDGRPEVRNCAVKTLTSALVSHGRKVGTICYQRCLRDILIAVLGEIQAATRRSRGERSDGPKTPEKDASVIVHHSRDTLEKQWDETMVLGIDNVRRVLSHFAEEATVDEFAPLAYSLLLQLQASLQTLNAEVSSAALRALIELMRTPASSQSFEAQGSFSQVLHNDLPASSGTSIWSLGWSVLWRMVPFCAEQQVPEALMSTFRSSLSLLRSSHNHLITSVQHMIVFQLAFVLITSPSFYLSSMQLSSIEVSKDDSFKENDDHNLEDISEAILREHKNNSTPVVVASSEDDRDLVRFIRSSGETLWNLASRTQRSSAKGYSKAAIAMKNFVDSNSSRNLELVSLETAITSVCEEVETSIEEALNKFLAAGRSPTHRNMMHKCSATLAIEQNNVFGLLEESHSFRDPILNRLFLSQLCSVFLDPKRVCQDSNKIALAARSLCLMVIFCRRLVFLNMAKWRRASIVNIDDSPCVSTGEDEAAPHLQGFIGVVPHLCSVLQSFICNHGVQSNASLQESGLWKLALEALMYVIEDSLPALELSSIASEAIGAYWDAVIGTLESCVKKLAEIGANPGAAADVDTLFQAIGNLVIHRILSSKVVPSQVAKRVVRLLGGLVGFQNDPSSLKSLASRQGLECSTLGLLFDLCERSTTADTGLCERSIVTIGACTDRKHLRSVHASHRPSLLASAVPVLLSRLRTLLSSFREGACLEELRFALSRLKVLRIDPDEFLVATPDVNSKARSACQLAGPCCCIMALMPQLTALSTCEDQQVRADVRELFEHLSSELGLAAV